ncbi:MAG: signal peptidase signal peptidase [Candidatus Paceibacter sp.]|jgi:signal peptidase I|nr:signal peptidase signal peptidase [Candidatus Paceibacter sp.]
MDHYSSSHSPSHVPSQPEPVQKKESFFVEIFKFTFIALLIVLPIRLFIAQPFIVSGASMDPTFETGQYLIVDQLSYNVGEPKRGQVVIFKYPKDETKYFIKRIIGLPGETVNVNGTSVTIKNRTYPDGFKLDEPYVSLNNEKEDSLTITLKNNEYFVMGDNRRESFDSRSWGALPRSDIIGKPFVRLFPLDSISIFPGNYKEAK